MTSGSKAKTGHFPILIFTTLKWKLSTKTIKAPGSLATGDRAWKRHCQKAQPFTSKHEERSDSFRAGLSYTQ